MNMAQHKLLGISGALRKESTNRKLIREAARLYGDADYTEADLNLPLYDGDVEAAGIPAAVQALADQIAGADAVVISGPEYNKSISGVLKNALDWVSRVEGNPWAGKPVAIVSAAAGRSGGEVAQFAMRQAMVSFQPMVVNGPAVLVGASYEAFDEAGQLVDERYVKALTGLMAALRAAVG